MFFSTNFNFRRNLTKMPVKREHERSTCTVCNFWTKADRTLMFLAKLAYFMSFTALFLRSVKKMHTLGSRKVFVKMSQNGQNRPKTPKIQNFQIKSPHPRPTFFGPNFFFLAFLYIDPVESTVIWRLNHFWHRGPTLLYRGIGSNGG